MHSFKVGKKIFLILGLIGFLCGTLKIGINYVWPQLHPFKNIQTVYDEANIMAEDQVAFIQNYHKELLKDHDIDYRIMSVSSNNFDDINRLAHEQFKEKKVGSLSQSGRGFLLLIDPKKNEVRLEVSAALEGVYTDSFVSYLQHRQMIPFFKTARVADGIMATTEMIFTRAQEAEKGQAFNPPMENKSIGGGVANPAHIGDGPDSAYRDKISQLYTGSSPMEVVDAYHRAMTNRDGSPELPIYSHETKVMMRSWTVTPAQMDNVARTFRQCKIDRDIMSGSGQRAVVRYPVAQRECSPYFLVLEKLEWKLDLTMMQKAIRFNHRNQWHFDLKYKPKSGPYGFAFTDWRFDQYGFPHK